MGEFDDQDIDDLIDALLAIIDVLFTKRAPGFATRHAEKRLPVGKDNLVVDEKDEVCMPPFVKFEDGRKRRPSLPSRASAPRSAPSLEKPDRGLPDIEGDMVKGDDGRAGVRRCGVHRGERRGRGRHQVRRGDVRKLYGFIVKFWFLQEGRERARRGRRPRLHTRSGQGQV